MSNSLSILYDSVEDLFYEDDGHYHMRIPTFFEFNSFSNERVDFIFDTGAYLTVIKRDEADLLGFLDKYTIGSNVKLTGFAGGCLADIKEIPGMVIGGRQLEAVKVAVPQIETDTNVLGLNVIGIFKYFMDTENNKIYFSYNPKHSIPSSLRCGSIHSVSAELTQKTGGVLSANIAERRASEEFHRLSAAELSVLKFVSLVGFLTHTDATGRYSVNTRIAKGICDGLVQKGFLHTTADESGKMYWVTSQVPKLEFMK